MAYNIFRAEGFGVFFLDFVRFPFLMSIAATTFLLCNQPLAPTKCELDAFFHSENSILEENIRSIFHSISNHAENAWEDESYWKKKIQWIKESEPTYVFTIDGVGSLIFKYDHERNLQDRYQNGKCLQKKVDSLGLKHIFIPRSKRITLYEQASILVQEKVSIIQLESLYSLYEAISSRLPQIKELYQLAEDPKQWEEHVCCSEKQRYLEAKKLFKTYTTSLKAYQEMIRLLVEYPFSTDLGCTNVAVIQEDSPLRLKGYILALIDLETHEANEEEAEVQVYSVISDFISNLLVPIEWKSMLLQEVQSVFSLNKEKNLNFNDFLKFHQKRHPRLAQL